ncbi:MAG: alpha/beta hydrolase [Gemmatimonadales bacterium]
MATPVRTRHTIGGVLGEILVDVVAVPGGRPGPAVLVTHGFKGFKDWGMFPPLAERLARAGFTAVTFNLSGSGVDDDGEFSRPERFGRNTFSAELADLALLFEALDGGGFGMPAPSSVGLLGHSRGGGMAVLAARRHPRVRALVTWAAVSSVVRWSEAQRRDWRAQGRIEIVNSRTGQVLPIYTDLLDDIEAHAESSLDIEAAAASLEIPWLIIHGDRDETVPLIEAEALARAAGELAELLTIEGGGHTFGAVHPWAGPTPQLDRVFDATVRFFSANLA